MVWQAVGVFARCEGMVENLIWSYTKALPDALASQILKRSFNTDERRDSIKAILADKELAAVYPDLPTLFKSVADRRNDVAHSTVMLDDDTERWYLRLHFRGRYKVKERWAVWRPEDVETFHADALRLDGLMMTLSIDMGITRFLRDGKWVTGTEVLGPVDPTEPRKPWETRDRHTG